ncbi:MAG: sigma 54-interacting transcriptional regulator [Ignavibacteria bacterium]
MVENLSNIKGLDKDQFESLYRLSNILNSVQYEDSLIEETLDLVIKITNAERGLFVKYEEEQFSIIAARNIEKQNIKNISEFSSGILQKVLRSKKPLLYHDAQSDPNLSNFASIQLQNIKSVIGVPVFKDESIWGIIIVDSQKNRKEFNNQNLILLSFFSNLISLSLGRIESFENLRRENIALKNKLETTEKIPDMIGESKVMRDFSKMLHRVAQTDTTVLIIGESGTGKDLAASAIHKLSGRNQSPFLAQFCGSISESLLESELFGYKKGAFTGASADKKGLLEAANKGTFFLDEIADISQALQAKLLRVIENKEIIRVGDTAPRKIDVRIISATNKDLQALVKNGSFREDLFYRLNVFPLRIPPLRERKGDIPLLAKYFAEKVANKKIIFHPKSIHKLESYYWPGNVRQLLNVIQRALIFCDKGIIKEEHIVLENEKDLGDFNGTLKDFEIVLLKKRLENFDGNRSAAAESLGVSRRWVQLKLKEIGD